MKFIFASGNNGKIEQARTLIKANGFNIELIPQKEIGFDVKEVFVTFDRNKLLESVKKSDMFDKTIINKYLRY